MEKKMLRVVSELPGDYYLHFAVDYVTKRLGVLPFLRDLEGAIFCLTDEKLCERARHEIMRMYPGLTAVCDEPSMCE